MKKLKCIFTLVSCLSIVSLVFSCKEEEPLKPNEAAALAQTSNFDGSEFNTGNGNNGNGGNNGGNNGGGSGVVVNESFSVYIDGALEVYPSPMFQSTFIGDQINSTINVVKQIQITSFSGFEVDTVEYPDIGYFKNSSSTYSSIDGVLIVDTLNEDFISGSFYCNVVNPSGTDTIALTDGQFKISK